MRRIIVGLVAFVVSLAAKSGTAQVTLLPTPPPQVTAANASWQLRAEPIFYGGDFYYPTGPNVFFDGNVMRRTGVYQGVSLYEDGTLEPYSIVYAPVGNNLMRPYERRRAGELAGTVGSRTPSFPIERDVEASAASGRFGIPPAGERVYRTAADVAPSQRGAGSLVCCACIPTTPCVPNIASGSQAEGGRPFAPTSIQSIPGPTSNDGIWVEFNGSRWSSRGSAVAFDPNQFTVAGMYRDVPVYQRRGGSDREIFIPSVAGGLLAPFQRQ
jgi:hypothetical protein